MNEWIRIQLLFPRPLLSKAVTDKILTQVETKIIFSFVFCQVQLLKNQVQEKDKIIEHLEVSSLFLNTATKFVLYFMLNGEKWTFI